MEDLNLYESLAEALKKPARVQRLSLDGLELTTVPADVFKLTNLAELGLSYNKLIRLPPELAGLSKLRAGCTRPATRLQPCPRKSEPLSVSKTWF